MFLHHAKLTRLRKFCLKEVEGNNLKIEKKHRKIAKIVLYWLMFSLFTHVPRQIIYPLTVKNYASLLVCVHLPGTELSRIIVIQQKFYLFFLLQPRIKFLINAQPCIDLSFHFDCDTFFGWV
jgi:hypothetical protein